MSEEKPNDSDVEFEDDEEVLSKRRAELARGAETKADPTDDETFRAAFDPKNPTYHGGLKTAVPIGGGRVPDSMKDHANWMELPEQAAEVVKPDQFGAQFEKLHYAREELNTFKKSIAAVLPVVAALIQNKAQLETAPSSSIKARIYENEKTRRVCLQTLQEMMNKYPRGGSEYGNELADVTGRASADDFTKEDHQALIERAKRLTAKVFNDQNKLLQQMKAAKAEFLKCK